MKFLIIDTNERNLKIWTGIEVIFCVINNNCFLFFSSNLIYYNSKMSAIKNIITKLYGFRMKFSKLTGLGISKQENDKKIKAPVSFYSLNAIANNGEVVPFEKFRNKKILIVNLASQCGFTPQYNELEDIFRKHKNDITVLGFPSNDFGGQEPGSDEEIEQFCKVNFGVTFPIFHKDHVKGSAKQPVYQWLCDVEKNGWSNKEPSWNFCKYLIDEYGNLDKVFSSSVSPLTIIS
jgi:glutathione peroxidase